MTLRAPFPYFGGKSKVSALVWSRFGECPNYIEPFAGSLAVLLSRPYAPSTETVNDIDGMIANFWRAVQSDPDGVVAHADWPVNEIDLHARHAWLVNKGLSIVDRLKNDPYFYDAKIAGWWVWGICAWIGSGWCTPSNASIPKLKQQRPALSRAGQGINQSKFRLAPDELSKYINRLSDRLRRVRVLCGDWTRVTGECVTFGMHGLTGVFLDPPYIQSGRSAVYAKETDVAEDVRDWAISNGKNPLMRIAYCGYESDNFVFPGWECIHWKADGGYGSQGSGVGRNNAKRERIWFSPHCLSASQGLIFFGELQ